jgi:HSP20 family protein
MLMRTDPFRELDRLTPQLFDATGTVTRPAVMPMDAYRSGNDYVVQFDLPGVSPDSIDLDVERNVLTVKTQRSPEFGQDAEMQLAQRPGGGVLPAVVPRRNPRRRPHRGAL